MLANCGTMYQNRRILLYFWTLIPSCMKMKRLSVHILLAFMLAVPLSCEKNPQPVTPDKPVNPDPEPEPQPSGPVVDYDKYQLKELAAKAGIKLGVSFTYWEYRQNAPVANILKKDFAAVTFGNEMKHDAIVRSNGQLNFSQADEMAAWAKSCGNELFGHTLGWHSQQQRSYLNNVISNAAPNNNASLVQRNWNFETGTLEGFVTEGFEMVRSSQSPYDVFAGDFAAKATKDGATLQVDAELEAGKTYAFSFWAKSLAGEGTVGLVSGDGQEAQTRISNSWCKYAVSLTIESAGAFACRLTASKDVVIDNIRIIDSEGQPSGEEEEKPVVIDFESFTAGGAGQLTSSGLFAYYNGGDYVSVTNEQAHGGSLSLKMDNSSGYASESYSIQVVTNPFPVKTGKTYRISWYAKASKAADFQIDIRGDGDTKYYNSLYGSFQKVGTDWTLQSYDYFVESGTELSFAFYGGVETVTYYIDDIRLEPVDGASFAPARRQAPAFKAGTSLSGELVNDAIGFVYKDWVYKMVEHFDVYGWDVVNETFADWPVAFRNTSNTTGDVFVWGTYFGGTQKWVDKAFAYATDALQRYGKSAVLYLNDYNLETIDQKRKAFCDYVKGNPQVTGVGTQMHLDMAGITREQIEASLKDLVATGRMVRISELDIKCTDQQAQAELYKFIFEKYLEIVPEAQRGGITIWGINDKDSWVKEENHPLLYKGVDYARKPAYETLYLYLCELAGLDPYKE